MKRVRNRFWLIYKRNLWLEKFIIQVCPITRVTRLPKQQSGFGAMLSFEFAGSFEQLKYFVGKLALFSLAESLGGVESLICHPASMTHRAMGEEALAEAGISQQLLRLSVGLEDASDPIADLDQAFCTLFPRIKEICE